MKVWVVQYLDCIDDVSFWRFDSIFDTEEKAKEYCKDKHEKWGYCYIYDEEYVE